MPVSVTITRVQLLPTTWQDKSFLGSLSSVMSPKCPNQLSLAKLSSDMMVGWSEHPLLTKSLFLQPLSVELQTKQSDFI